MFKVIVAGSREFSDYDFLKNKLNHLLKNKTDICILCGMARGADMLGKRYAEEYGLHIEYYPADWEKDGKSAGYLRNILMAENADALVAFWDGKSKGTKHMIDIAKTKGLEVKICYV